MDYGGPIRSHLRSFEWYHPRPPTASSPRFGVRNPHPKFQSLLSQERVKLWTLNLAGTFTGSIQAKPIKILQKGVWTYPNFWGTPYYLRNR